LRPPEQGTPFPRSYYALAASLKVIQITFKL
jgi:hypothetical protein